MTNPLEDPEWVRDNANAIFRYVTRDIDERERTLERQHRELVQTHRDGWKNMAAALRDGLGLIADAIRSRR